MRPAHLTQFLAFLVLLLWGQPPLAAAHTAGVTRVDLLVEPTALRIQLELHARDLLRNALTDSLGRTRFADSAHVAAEAERISRYVTRRIRVSADGVALEVMPVDGARPHVAAVEGTAVETATEPEPQIVPFALVVALPASARRLDVTLDLYREDDVAALFDISTRRTGGWSTRTDYLTAGSRVSFDLRSPGLDDPGGTSPDSTIGVPGSAGQRPAAGVATSLSKTIRQFLVLGFTHILPHGLDHILFVLGLFLLTPRVRPLLGQVTAFTLAHSLTLALAMLGLVRIPAMIVEPLIALSISVVAAENILRPEAPPSRRLFVFAFGLVHGLGFAAVLTDLGVPEGRLLPALMSFNLGVEIGQLTVIGLAGLLVLPLRNRGVYRRWVAVPASLAIALVGVLWAVQRVFPNLHL